VDGNKVRESGNTGITPLGATPNSSCRVEPHYCCKNAAARCLIRSLEIMFLTKWYGDCIRWQGRWQETKQQQSRHSVAATGCTQINVWCTYPGFQEQLGAARKTVGCIPSLASRSSWCSH